jgi:hypothetical protein
MRIRIARLALVALAAGVVGYLLTRSRCRRCGCTSAALRGNELTRVFHEPTCRYADSDNCTAVFATREEAVEAGYEPCQVCLP